MKLRDYQQRTIDMLYSWFYENRTPEKHPCLVLPTGAGKSLVIAALVRDAIEKWPETRVLMLTHQKELIEQNAEKLKKLWPLAPLGIYSASLNKKILHRQITYAGIQSIRKKAKELGHIDLVLVDECHLINHTEQGGYRQFIGDLREINPSLRIIGLTATEYRLGHGLITEGKDRLFTDLIKPVSIEELIGQGYLSRLESKPTRFILDVSEVGKRGGDFVEKLLQEATDKDEIITAIISEVMPLASNLRSMLWFCTGVENAEHYAEHLRALGETAYAVTGKTPKGERARLLSDFKSGKIRHLTNANVLTTGFDAPNIDGIVMARPTLSASLYVQMAGRGLRLKDHTDHCRIFDFAGNIRQHGPITNVTPPSKKGSGKGGGKAPTKECPECEEILHASAKYCPSCHYIFVPDDEDKPKPRPTLHHDDILGLEDTEIEVSGWTWRAHRSRKNGKFIFKITYHDVNLAGDDVSEYICLFHDGFAGQKAVQLFSAIYHNGKGERGFFVASDYQPMLEIGTLKESEIVRSFCAKPIEDQSDIDILQAKRAMDKIIDALKRKISPPKKITYRKVGKFHEVSERVW